MPTDAEKLATLQAMQAAGENPRVAELVRVGWPAPDGPIYYATVIAADLLDSDELIAQLDGPIVLALPGNQFLDLTHDSGIADDKVPLEFWDGPAEIEGDPNYEISRLFATHGEGARVEAFYWFPDVELLISEWWGHLRPPETVDRDRFKASAEAGFMSSMLPLPRRAFFTSCQALFGGLLRTQEEINEGDCPYSRHLGGGEPTTSIGTDDTWKRHTSPPDGWMLPGFDDSAWSDAFEVGDYGITPWGEKATFPASTPAKWIWDSDTRTNYVSNPSVIYFRKEFTADEVDALLVVTADDGFVAYLDGVQVLVGSNWQQSYSKKLTLVEGQTYCLAIKGINNGFISGVIAQVAFGITALGFGNLNPATGQPYTSCPRNNRQVCIDRLEPEGATQAPSYLAFDTIIDSFVVNQTKGANITVTSRGNENFLKRPLRVVAGERDVSDLDVLAYAVEPNTNHPDQGSARVLVAASEGPDEEMTLAKINETTIAAEHLNIRLGERRQPRTSFSASVQNYSSTALFYGVVQGDFTKANQTPGAQNTFQASAHIKGLRDVRVYTDALSFTEQYSRDRAWWLLHIERNKRWGQGHDVARFVIQDFIELSRWGRETVSIVDSSGTRSTGQRTTFNAELIDRNAQQQVNDLCASGRFSLPFPHQGKMRVVPLRRASELFSSTIFVDRAYWATFDRAPTDEELADGKAALETARLAGAAELLAEGVTQLDALFNADDYDDRDRSDEELVSDLYQAFFNHPGDEAGSAFWLAQVIATSRAAVLTAFGESDEFALRMQDQDVLLFTDTGDARNIVVDQAGKPLITSSQQSDADLANRWVVTFDDAAHQNQQTPLIFEDSLQQLAAGRAFGDFSMRQVERQFSAFGVVDAGEAARLGNTLLALGELDEGGTENNFRVTFTTWYSFTVTLHKYGIIKVVSPKIDAINTVRVSKGLEPWVYFRIRSLQRHPDLQVEISAQAYPVSYYEQLELITTPPPIPPSTFDPNPGGGDGGPTRRVGFENLTHTDDRINFKLEVLES